ncbi:cation:proton antiporter [Gillisia marina]|uniref:cation:proton antiporter n=1 Tax=Gillisia marina TaxID=1167637 RepID=UPI00029ABA4B|nr:cation:proton antiporter [Gillisia marina]
MNEHFWIIAGVGIVFLIMAWLPSISKKLNISYPVILLLIGVLLFYLGLPIKWPDPFWDDEKTKTLSEFIVVISLMAAGLKIPKFGSWKIWKGPFRFIVIGMPLTMLGFFFVGTIITGLSVMSALLLAAVLAPTDPVLAAEVQLDDLDQQDGNGSESEFSLTAEAGLNDGLAFPFTVLAVLIIKAKSWSDFDLNKWIWDDFLLRIVLGLLLGFVLAKSLIYLHRWLCKQFSIETKDGLLAFALAISVYAITELLHGYGFLAVFIASLVLKNSDSINTDYKEKLHNFVDELERLLLVVWILLFGGSIMNGILTISNWEGVIFAVIGIFIIRPVAGMVSLIGHPIPIKEKMIASFFGIRGIGSLFYLAWAFIEIGPYEDKELLYSIVAVVILTSLVVHGFTAPYIFNKQNNNSN